MNCMNCNRPCNKLCPNFIISDSISVVTVGGVDTLVIDIPAGSYGNCKSYCIITAQPIPATATVNQPVAISIGGDTTTVYPLVCCKTGLQAVACQINTRSRYKVCVRTSATSGSFVVQYGLGSCFTNNLASLPAPTTTTATATVRSFSATPSKTTKTVTTTKKEVIANE